MKVSISRMQVVEEKEEKPACPAHRAAEAMHTSTCRACVPASVRSHVSGSARDIWRFAPKANKSAMPEIRPWPLPSNCADKLRGSLIKRPVTDVMSSTHKPPADCESHIQQSQLSARKHGGRQGGRPLRRSRPDSLPPPPTCIYLYVSFYFVSPPARDPALTCAEYLSGLSKNDLEGRGQSIFSDSGRALTISGT